MSTRTRNTECSVCGEFFTSDTIPGLEQCTHEPTVCQGCFQGWLTAQVADVNWDRIACPSLECSTHISHFDIHRLASQETYARYEELSLRSFLSGLPSFRYCLRPGCSSGQIHIEDSNLFRCVFCQFLVCTTHNVPFHMGETCAEYDERTHSIENDASNAVIQDTTKQCPGEGCSVPIEKNDGCDHMTCQRCRHEFCWICMAPYRGVAGIWLIGNHAHTRDCIHWRARDIPAIEDNMVPIPRARDPLPRDPLPRDALTANPLPRNPVPPNPLLRNPVLQDPPQQDPPLLPPRWRDHPSQDPPQPGLPRRDPLPRVPLPQAPPRPAPPQPAPPPVSAPPAPAPPAPAPPAPAPPAPAPPVPVPRRRDPLLQGPQAVEIRPVARPRNGFWAALSSSCGTLFLVFLIVVLGVVIERLSS